jgi:CheY-like chemotaxis protein
MTTILVVDDHPDIRHLIRLLLDRSFNVIEADNGATALEMTRLHHPSVVVLDVMMPGEVDGLEALRVIKSDPDLKAIYVIMVTARGQATDYKQANTLGADAYFVKPFSPLALASHIRSYLQES